MTGDSGRSGVARLSLDECHANRLRMHDPDCKEGLLYIEPKLPPSPEPLIDGLTKRMAYELRTATIPSNRKWYRGEHTCTSPGCQRGAPGKFPYVTSTNFDVTLSTGRKTNSLAVHYLAYHRQEVPKAMLELLERELYSNTFDPQPVDLLPPEGFDGAYSSAFLAARRYVSTKGPDGRWSLPFTPEEPLQRCPAGVVDLGLLTEIVDAALDAAYTEVSDSSAGCCCEASVLQVDTDDVIATVLAKRGIPMPKKRITVNGIEMETDAKEISYETLCELACIDAEKKPLITHGVGVLAPGQRTRAYAGAAFKVTAREEAA